MTVICAIACLMSIEASADTLRPVKVSSADIGGSLLKDVAVTEGSSGDAASDLVTFTSQDNAFQTGIFKSGPAHEEMTGPLGYPDHEFLYFIAGSVRRTSADGSVLEVGAGEAVTLPEGWIGKFDTRGYTKLYVLYHTGSSHQ